jgi:hypothetical protein
MTGTVYEGWRQVPDGLMTATQLGELEYPRLPLGRPTAWVTTYDWRDKKTEVALYDARQCPPTKSSAKALTAAAARSTRGRVCADCGARCERPIPADVGDRPLCPVCRLVVQLRVAQQGIAAGRATLVAQAQEWLARPDVAIVQVDLVNPGPTPGGSARRDTAIRVAAVDVDGRRMVDALVSLVGPKARIVEPDAIPTADGAAIVHGALIGRPLIAWEGGELLALVRSLPHADWPERRWGSWDEDRIAAVQPVSTRWRGQLDERRNLVPSLPPGTPDRVLLHLQRIAADDIAAARVAS